MDMEPLQKIVFLGVMAVFKNGRHFKPEIEIIFELGAVKYCSLDLRRL